MNSILDTPETKPSAAGGGPGTALGMVGAGLAVAALGMAAYLFVELRDARRQIARLTEQASTADKKTKDLDLGPGRRPWPDGDDRGARRRHRGGAREDGDGGPGSCARRSARARRPR